MSVSLCFSIVLLTSAAMMQPTWAKTALSPEAMYGSITQSQSCLSLTWNTAAQQMRGPAASNCLRMAFHDAGTFLSATGEGGANGSVMLELANPESAGLTLCPNAITAILQQVHNNGCPQLTTADAIQVAGAAAVHMLGGPACPMLMGRPDKGAADSSSSLPDKCGDAASQVAGFRAMGFQDPVKAVTVLSGAHNVGNSRATPRGTCSRGLGPLTAAPGSFDGHYYTEVVTRSGRGGWFDSDRHLNDQGAPTAALMQAYSSNHQAFLADWCGQYQEMSLLGLNLPAGYTVTSGWAPIISVNLNPGPNNGGAGRNNNGPNNGGPNNGGPNNGGPNNGGPNNGGPNNGGAGPQNGGPGPRNGGPNVGR